MQELVTDRDLNAAINLRNKSAIYVESACEVFKQLNLFTFNCTMNQEVNVCFFLINFFVMKIDKFKLISGGIEGIEVWRTEPVKKGNLITIDQVRRVRRIQIDKSLRESIQGLKYYFLQLTRHWIAPYNNYFDKYTMKPMLFPKDDVKAPHKILKVLWNDTSITGLSVKNDGFVITGTIESIPDKKIGISTPYITSEDDIGFYMEAMEKIEKIGEEINKYLYSRLLPIEEAREQYMLENKKTSITEAEDEALIEKLVQKFQEKGAIVIMSDENDIEALEVSGNNDLTIHKSRTVINKEGIPSADILPPDIPDDAPEQIIIKENKGVEPKDTLVGNIEFPQMNTRELLIEENL